MPEGSLKSAYAIMTFLSHILGRFSIVLKIKHNTLNRASKPRASALSLQPHLFSPWLLCRHATPFLEGAASSSPSGLCTSVWNVLLNLLFQLSCSSLRSWLEPPFLLSPDQGGSPVIPHTAPALLYGRIMPVITLNIRSPTRLMKVEPGPVLSTHHMCQQGCCKACSQHAIHKCLLN